MHGASVNNVNLHETSSIDTFVDLVGCATALQDLGLFDCRIISTKVAVGGGTVKFSHGTYPIRVVQYYRSLRVDPSF